MIELLKKMAATYSPSSTSTIGAEGLNFSVRKGKRWFPFAIVTKKSLSRQRNVDV